MVRPLILVAVSIGLSWLVFAVLLLLVRPRGMDLAEARRLVPNIARLLKELTKDEALPRVVRWRLGALLLYLALPFDLIPDFIPVLGYADDVIVVALVLRSVVRAAGASAIERHWTGTSEGLRLVERLAGPRRDADAGG